MIKAADRLGMAAVAFSLAALFSYSMSFRAAYAMPKLMVFGLGLLVMASSVARGAGVDLRRSLCGPGLIVLSVGIVSCVFADEPFLALLGRHNSYAMGLLGLAIAFCYHIAAASTDNHAAALWIATAGAILGVHALAQKAGFDAGLSSTLTGNRAIATIGSPVDLGIVLAMILPIAICESWIFASAIVLGIFATGSRGAWIGAVVGILAMRDINWPRVIGISILVTGLAWTALSRNSATSDIERKDTWAAAYSTFKAHPLIGVGIDGFEGAFRLEKKASFSEHSGSQVAADAHNDVLQAAATSGIAGVLAYILLVIATFRRVAGAARGALAAFFVQAKIQPIPLEALVLIGVIVGVAAAPALSQRAIKAVPRGVIAIGALVVAFLVANLARADYYAQQGEFVKACAINRWELDYKVGFLNSAVNSINSTNDLTVRAGILKASRAQVAEAITLRPNAAMSWYLAGVEAQIERRLGVARDPQRYFSRAVAIDPNNRLYRALLEEARKERT